MAIGVVSVKCYLSCLYKGYWVFGVQTLTQWFTAQCLALCFTELCLMLASCETTVSDISDIFYFALLVGEMILNFSKTQGITMNLAGVLHAPLLPGIFMAVRAWWGVLSFLLDVLWTFLPLYYTYLTLLQLSNIERSDTSGITGLLSLMGRESWVVPFCILR